MASLAHEPAWSSDASLPGRLYVPKTMIVTRLTLTPESRAAVLLPPMA